MEYQFASIEDFAKFYLFDGLFYDLDVPHLYSEYVGERNFENETIVVDDSIELDGFIGGTTVSESSVQALLDDSEDGGMVWSKPRRRGVWEK